MGLPSCFMEKKFVEGEKGDDITPFDGRFEIVPISDSPFHRHRSAPSANHGLVRKRPAMPASHCMGRTNTHDIM
jgi:hypothetical protein